MDKIDKQIKYFGVYPEMLDFKYLTPQENGELTNWGVYKFIKKYPNTPPTEIIVNIESLFRDLITGKPGFPSVAEYEKNIMKSIIKKIREHNEDIDFAEYFLNDIPNGVGPEYFIDNDEVEKFLYAYYQIRDIADDSPIMEKKLGTFLSLNLPLFNALNFGDFVSEHYKKNIPTMKNDKLRKLIRERIKTLLETSNVTNEDSSTNKYLVTYQVGSWGVSKTEYVDATSPENAISIIKQKLKAKGQYLTSNNFDGKPVIDVQLASNSSK